MACILKTIRLPLILLIIVVSIVSGGTNLGRLLANTSALPPTGFETLSQTGLNHPFRPTSPEVIEVWPLDDQLIFVLRLRSQWVNYVVSSPIPDEGPAQVLQMAAFGNQTHPGDRAGISGSLSLVSGLDRHFVLYLRMKINSSGG